MDYNGIMTSLVAIDSATSKVKASLAATYGPYADVASAYTALSTAFTASGIPVGLTVGIISGSTIVEYWFNGGITQSNLVPKQTTSTVPSLTISSTAVTDTTTYLEATYPSASIKDQVLDTTTGSLYIKYATGSWVKIAGTILTNTAPTTATITGATILSLK